MSGPPVLTVPSLAQASADMTAPVYVFKSGVKGDGPFGLQAEVFPVPPPSEQSRPLRLTHFITGLNPLPPGPA